MMPTLFRLIPVKSARKVLLMVRLLAFDRGPWKLRDGSCGRETQLMTLAVVNAPKDSVDRVVRLNKSKLPPIELMVELPNVIRPPALWQVRLPRICPGPSRLIAPTTASPMTTLPERVGQPEYWAKSAWELRVTVGCAQAEAVAVWAGKNEC